MLALSLPPRTFFQKKLSLENLNFLRGKGLPLSWDNQWFELPIGMRRFHFSSYCFFSSFFLSWVFLKKVFLFSSRKRWVFSPEMWCAISAVKVFFYQRQFLYLFWGRDFAFFREVALFFCCFAVLSSFRKCSVLFSLERNVWYFLSYKRVSSWKGIKSFTNLNFSLNIKYNKWCVFYTKIHTFCNCTVLSVFS